MNLHYRFTPLLEGVGCKELNTTLSPIPDETTMLQAIDTFTFGFLKLDFNSKVLYWSAAAEKLTGYKSEKVLGKSIFETIHEIDSTKFHKKWQQLRVKQHLRFREYYWATQSWLEFYAYPADQHVIIYFKDITKKIAIRKKLSLKINQLRDISVFNSHEIRKSLANLIGLTDMLSEKIKLEEFREYVSYINQSAKDLDSVIINFNAIVNNSFQSLTPRLTHFNFKHLVSQIKAELTLGTNQLVVRCTPAMFYGNLEDISNSIKSLILNCITKTPIHAKTHLNVTLKNGLIYVQIKNIEHCISLENKKHLHAQITDSKFTIKENNLLKVAQVCEIHSGSFWIEDLSNKGSKYVMVLPVSNFSSFGINKSLKIHNARKNEMLVNFDVNKHYIEVKWIGHFDQEAKRKNFYKLLSLFKTSIFTRIISDETAIIGGNTNVVNWLAKYGLPLLIKSGLTQFAWIVSANEFSKLSAASVLKKLNKSPISIFTEHREAKMWIAGNTKKNTE